MFNEPPTQRWSQRRWSLVVPLPRLAFYSGVAQLLVVRPLMNTTPESLAVIQKLRAEKKFVEEDFYPGACDEDTRQRCQTRVDELLDDTLALLGRDASKEEIPARSKTTIDLFEEEETEEREKVGDYIGEMMRAIGLDDWTDFI